MRTFILLSLALLSLTLPSRAQSQEIDPRVSLLKLSLAENKEIYIAVQSIVSISKHIFKLNGETPITEVTIDTVGNNSIRFYYVHPAGSIRPTTNPKEMIGAARQKLNQELTRQKDENIEPSIKFPEGTYAHTIEFQIADMEMLDKIYKTSVKAWERNAKKITELPD